MFPAAVKVVTSGTTAQGIGAGFYVRSQNGKTFIVTSNHVVWGASHIEIENDEGTSDEGNVVGTDPMADLAVLQTRGSNAADYLNFGDDGRIVRGDQVFAVGSPLGVRNAVSSGILSARAPVPQAALASELFVDYLLTDLALSSGDSGGPLLDAEGVVVGVNEAVMGGNPAVGVAMPSRLAQRVFEVLAKGENYSHSFGGFRVTDEGGSRGKAIVTAVVPSAPAARCDLRIGDRVLALNGKRVDAAEIQWRQFMDGPGKLWRLDIERDGNRIAIEIVLDTLTLGTTLPR